MTQPSRHIPHQASLFIDAARWMAAFAVLITHVNANALVILADIPAGQRGLIAYIAWIFYGFAHQAVVVFFVVSGFLVGGGVMSRLSSSEPFLARYLTDRIVRIGVVLLPVLAITFLLDAAGRSLFAGRGIYEAPVFAGHFGMLPLLANIASLQDIFFPTFGTNSALWTLAHEFWYYITFPLLMLPWAQSVARPLRLAGFALGLALLIGMSASLSWHLFGFGLWLCGTAAARLPRALLRSRTLAFVLFLGVAVGIRLFVRYALLENIWIGGLADAAVALAFANLLLTLRFAPGVAWGWTQWRGHHHLSDFSYSLYALHMPLVVFLCASADAVLGFGSHSVPVSAREWALGAALILCVSVVGWAFSRLTEARTPFVRAWVWRLVSAKLQPRFPAGRLAPGE